MTEFFRDIEGYPNYKISSLGRVFSRCRSKCLKVTIGDRGYPRVSLSHEGVQRGFFVHRLVAAAFLSNTNKCPQVNHKNGKRNDNQLENLEWVTNGENQIHAYRALGRKPITRPVVQFNRKGKFIREWQSGAEACRDGFDDACISLCCNGMSKTHRGFIWKFKENARARITTKQSEV